MAISQEWWDDWWEQDYSWDGLAKKRWWGWVVPEDGVPVPEADGVEGRQATLQDYWRRAGLAEDVDRPEFRCPQTKRRFTRVHLPLLFRDGSQTLKGAEDAAFSAGLNDILKAELAKPIVETRSVFFGLIKDPDNRLQWEGAVLPDLNLDRLSTQTRSKDGRIPISLQAMNAAFLGEARFDRAAFSGYAWFYRAAFSGDASFNSAAFSGDASFDSAAFSGDAGFDSAAFSRDARFNSAAFSGDASFYSAAFLGDASFYSAAFSGDAIFKSAVFSGDASFYSAAFSGDARFDSAAFSGDAIFNSAAFSRYAIFNSAAFSGDASFYSAAFSEDASFYSAAFSGHARFKSAAFSGDAWFNSAAFLSKADFSGEGRSLTSERVDQSIALLSQSHDKGVALEGHMRGEPAPLSITRRSVRRFIAQGAVFLGPADFSNRDILDGPDTDQSDFHGAHFFHLFKLHSSVLHRGINFGKTRVEFALERGKTHESCLPVTETLTAGLAALKRAVPRKPQPPWEDAPEEKKQQYVRDVSKWSALYEGGLEAFQEWRRSEAQAFAEGPVKNRIDYFRALEDCYRTLKQFNEDRRDRPEEGRFFRLELIARRRRRRPEYSLQQLLAFWQEKEGIPIWERVLSHIYGGASNYGNSVVLPIVWLIGGVFVFALAYMLMGDWFLDRPSWKHFGEALSFSFGQVLPFGPWDTPDPCTAIGQMLDPLTGPAQAACEQHLGDGFELRAYRDGTPIGLRLLASFQSLTAIILVFLSGLAVRRRFQIN
nr:pentapeptide repeat-containing protein [uncultured Hyphomonas sp.]